MDISSLLFQLLPIFAILSIFYFYKKYTYWSRLGVKSPTPLPIIGNIWEPLVKGMVHCELDWVQRYGKVYGTYSGLEPSLTIADPELIKQVLVKDFNVFVNRDLSQFDHEIWSRNLFNLENDDWKRVRSITSPSFTSGKLRAMHRLMGRCIEKLDVYFQKLTQGDGIMNTKKVMSGFTIDVIASTSFATETNANDSDDRQSDSNVFVRHGTNLLNFRPLRIVAMLVTPKCLRKYFGYDLVFEPDSFAFFCDLAKQIIKQRKASKVEMKRNDLVQLLMDSYVSEKELDGTDFASLEASNEMEKMTEEHNHTRVQNIKTLDDIEIIAQCIVFFIAGFETTASTLTHALYELALSPEIQQKLYEEIKSATSELRSNSEQYYETVMGAMPYLEAVIKETLRIYPPLPRLSRRIGVNGYHLGGVPLRQGQEVEIATFAVHHNAEYYPDPSRFNPDRFIPDNKHSLVPYTFLPFGAGPRNCIGMRFAYQEIKLCLAHIVQRYKFEPTTETPRVRVFKKIGTVGLQDFQLKVVQR